MQGIARKPWQMTFVLFTMFSVVGVTLPRTAHAQVGPQAITGCTKITQPGSYLLVNNIRAATANLIPTTWGIPGCLVIAADFVTLDLGGFTIFGPGKVPGVDTAGVINADNTNRGITVHSGVVTKFTMGVVLTSSLNVAAGYVVEHVRAIDNLAWGITVYSVGSRIVGNVATNNGLIGFYIMCPSIFLENVAYGIPVTTGLLEAGGFCTDAENKIFP